MESKQYKDNRPAELLAPAGTFDSLKAAINAGADAIYLGGTMFGARAFAGNFDREELLEAIKLAHLYGRKIYLTVNTLLRTEELDRLTDYIRPYYEAGLDAVIVQDFGVFSLLREEFPDMALHASTQMTITGALGAELLKKMGASRIVTARELSLEEIRHIHDNVDIEIESFVHGALCYSYSGQCLLSSMIGGRSGNRGRCAQPCRLTYSCGAEKSRHLLSPKDMCTIEALPDILESGVYSLKLEGRMKSPEYVAGVVSCYRKYLDMYFAYGRAAYKVDGKDILQLMDIYNRGGFCKGYYYRHNDKNMMTFDRPNHQGIQAGTFKDGCIDITEDVNAGDVLELEAGKEFTVAASYRSGEKIKIPYIKGGTVKKTGKVYRTRNSMLLAKLSKEYVEAELKLPVTILAEFDEGHHAKLVMALKGGTHKNSTAAGETAEEATAVNITGDVLEQSKSHPAAEDEVKRQLLKLGNTPFSCADEDISIQLTGNPFVPVRLLNTMRREAAQKLVETITSKGMRKNVGQLDRKNENGSTDCTADNLSTESSAAEKTAVHSKTEKPVGYGNGLVTTVQVLKEEQLKAVLESCEGCVGRVYISTELEGIEGAVSMCRRVKEYNKNSRESHGKAMEAYLALPYIFRANTVKMYDDNWNRLADEFDGILVRSPEELEYLAKRDTQGRYKGRIMADYNMYTYNPRALSEYEELGIASFTMPQELSARQLKQLNEACDRQCVNGGRAYREKIVYGHLPLMITAGCTLAYTSKDKPCGSPSVYHITDRMKKRLPAVNSCFYCYNIIYNCVPEYLYDRTQELLEIGADGVRLMFTVETPDETAQIMKGFRENETAAYEYTRGHYSRGVD